MKQKDGFYDLSVTALSKTQLVNVFTAFIQLGYRTVAVNQIVEESAFETQRKKRKGDKEVISPIPAPVDLADIPQEIRKCLKILHRLTVYISSSDMAHKMISSDNIKRYDILAVIPTSKSALQHLCNSMDIDIISIDPSTKNPVRWNRKLYNLAVEKGMWFELPYATAVLDSNARRNLIEAGHSYHAFGKSKNILISSGAENPMQVRGPYDVINLGLLLGLSEEQAKRAITHACRSLVLRAESRTRSKAVVIIEPIVLKPTDTKGEERLDEDMLQPASKKMCIDSN